MPGRTGCPFPLSSHCAISLTPDSVETKAPPALSAQCRRHKPISDICAWTWSTSVCPAPVGSVCLPVSVSLSACASFLSVTKNVKIIINAQVACTCHSSLPYSVLLLHLMWKVFPHSVTCKRQNIFIVFQQILNTKFASGQGLKIGLFFLGGRSSRGKIWNAITCVCLFVACRRLGERQQDW